MSHTPTPWYVVGPPWGDGSYVVAGSPDPHQGRFVCDFAGDLEEWEEDERDVLADAEFTCRAVNKHEELLELLRQCVGVVANAPASNDGIGLYPKLLAAIEKADR